MREPHDSTPESMHSYSHNLHVRPRSTTVTKTQRLHEDAQRTNIYICEAVYIALFFTLLLFRELLYVSPFLSRFLPEKAIIGHLNVKLGHVVTEGRHVFIEL